MDAHDWDERYAATGLVWSAGPNQFVEAELADMPPGRALDLAAGEGRNAIWLARQGWQVTAVDFSQAGLDKGRLLAGDLGVDWVCADATTWRRAEDVLTDLGGETFEVQRAGRVARIVGDGHGEEPTATAWDCLVRVVRRAA
jgi:SAM-dependent methyltransferase